MAVDASPAAVTATRHRLDGRDGVRVEQREVPAQWPERRASTSWCSRRWATSSVPGPWSAPCGGCGKPLTPDGVLLAAHWRHPVQGWPLDGDEVHRRLAAADLPPLRATYADPDVAVVVHAPAGSWPDPHR